MPSLLKNPVGFCCFYGALAILSACGGEKNAADCDEGISTVPCSKRTSEEEARLALQNGDYDHAVTLLEKLVEEEPGNRARYPLLASAYAARSGLDLLGLAKAQFGGSSGFLDLFKNFVPSPSQDDTVLYGTRIADMKSAVSTLKSLPAADLAPDSTASYAASAALQLSLYQASYAVMNLNQFTVDPASGSVDLNRLQNMSEDDAVTIVSAIADSGQVPQAEGNAAVQTKLNEGLQAISSQPGETTKEKLSAYIQAQKAKGGSSQQLASNRL